MPRRPGSLSAASPAKALFAKGLFKEAEIVLGNAAALDGAVKEPLFLMSCLVRQGQLDKALAQGLKHVGTDALEPGEGRLLSELTAAMFLARPVPLAARGDPPARVEWIAAANAARKALAALTAQKPPDEIEPFIAAIPARSPFGPVRLIVKSLIIDDPAKARRFVDGVPQASPFGPLRLAAEATLPGEPAEVVGRLNEASPAQRAFALEWLLMQAIELATARKAFKKAAGFAKKLLSVDPINRLARQRMIELKISHARKQMRAKRPDLVSNELAAAGEWERADAPNADLRINQGLVGLRGGQDPQAEARLREGVDLAGRRSGRLVPRSPSGRPDGAATGSPGGTGRRGARARPARGAREARDRRHRRPPLGAGRPGRPEGDVRARLEVRELDQTGNARRVVGGGVPCRRRRAPARAALRRAARIRRRRQAARAERF